MKKTKMLDNKKISFGVYLIFIILIILIHPEDIKKNGFYVFSGWDFIWWVVGVGDYARINLVYLFSEIGIVSLVYFFYLQSIKKK